MSQLGEVGEDDDESEDAPRLVRFHTTAISDLVILYIVSLGFYSVFWFYQHWVVLKRTRHVALSPLARAFFSVFFTHRLFKIIDEGARASGLNPAWNPSSQATTYVVLILMSRFALAADSDQLATWVIGLTLFTANALPLVTAQRVANFANGRPELEDEDEGEDEDEDEDDQSA